MNENGKVLFVTGASRGLGATIARAALAAGFRVVATGRDAAAVERALGGTSDRALALRLDVTDEGEARAAVRAAVERFGRIDVLVNNAGYALMGTVEEVSAEEVQAQYATNVFGLLNVTRAALPVLRGQGAGHILNLSSVGGYWSGAGCALYCSTKFAVEGISEGLAAEMAPFGVRVTIVEPGYFRTDFLADNSVRYAARELSEYADGSRDFFRARNGQQEGDPERLAAALLRIVAMENPPLHLPLGGDAVEVLEGVLDGRRRELDAHRELSLSTGFTEGA